MANQGLTPEQFEILFGDVIRREIEMLAAQESEHGATHLEGSTEVFDIASGQTSVIPAQPAPAQIDTSAPIPTCLLYTSPSPRDGLLSRMPSSA